MPFHAVGAFEIRLIDRLVLAAVSPGLPPVTICRFCGFPCWAGRLGCLVDVTSYLFLVVRCVIDQVRLAGQMVLYRIKRAATRGANRHTRLPGPGQSRDGLCCGGRCATRLGLGAARRTSAACVTFRRWIRASWWIVCCLPAPTINRRTRINRGNRRALPPGVTPGAYCDGGDE